MSCYLELWARKLLLMSTDKDVLSSSNLFNFTSKFDVLKLILQNGFRYNKWEESLPKNGVKQENYIVCFCDIPWTQNKEHRDCYGNNGIVLTKEWGIRKEISPVRYINGTSVGMSDRYMQTKTTHREMLETSGYELADSFVKEIVLQKYICNGSLKGMQSVVQKNAADPKFAREIQDELDTFAEMEKAIVDAKFQDFYEQMKGRVAFLLESLYDELERRDAFERNYTEDFTHPNSGFHPDKILYNEREWRSVKHLGVDALLKPDAPDHLPPSENLTFEDDDVVAILVERKEYVEPIKDMIIKRQTLLSPDSASKVIFVEEYRE